MPFDIPVTGGNVGGLHIPQQREHETSAFAEVNKAALGIVYDSIAKVLTDLAPRYNFGYLGGFGYRATADRNVLDHPLESVRVRNSFDTKPDESWMPLYNAMTEALPPNILRHLLAENNKPFDQRNSSFVALDNLLKAAAHTLAQIHRTAQPDSMESIEASRATMNILLPFALLQNTLHNSREMAQAAFTFLESEGANFPNFDAYTKLLGEMKVVLQLMQFVEAGLNDTPGGKLNDATRGAAVKATLILATLNEQIGRATPGSDLTILPSTLQNMETVLTALSLPTVTLGALYVSLNTALFGMGTQDSALGFVGPNLALAFTGLSNGIADNILPAKEHAGARLLSHLVTFSLVVAIGLSAQMLDPGFGILPKSDPPTEAAARFFAFETALALIAGSGFVKEIYKELIASAGGDIKAQEKGSTALENISLLMMMYVASLIGKRPSEDLVADHTKHLEEALDAIKEMQEHKEVNAEVSIALEQARIALDNKDYAGFNEAIASLIESQGATLEGIKNDIKGVAATAQELVNVTGSSKDDEPRTEIVNVV